MIAECILPVKNQVGENPTWDWRTQRLYWIDNKGSTLYRFDPASGGIDTWTMPAFVGSFALTQKESSILLGMASGAKLLDLETEEISEFAPAPFDPKRFRLNDGHCDRAGRFVTGTNDAERGSSESTNWLYQIADGKFTAVVPDVAITNGIAFSPDNRTLYRSEFLDRVILAYDYDSDRGEATNRRLFAEIPEGLGYPDGAAVDAEGGYWIALFGGSRVVRFDQDGVIDREITLTATQPTMLSFGGPDLRTVYVTSAQFPEPSPDLGENAGGLFSVESDVAGLPEAFVTV